MERIISRRVGFQTNDAFEPSDLPELRRLERQCKYRRSARRRDERSTQRKNVEFLLPVRISLIPFTSSSSRQRCMSGTRNSQECGPSMQASKEGLDLAIPARDSVALSGTLVSKSWARFGPGRRDSHRSIGLARNHGSTRRNSRHEAPRCRLRRREGRVALALELRRRRERGGGW